MNEEFGVQKMMVRTLASINKLMEIAYIFAFTILRKRDPLLAMLLELGGKIGLKGKPEDTIGRTIKGLSFLFIQQDKPP